MNAANLISIAGICYEKYGIYSGLNEDLTNFSNNVVVGSDFAILAGLDPKKDVLSEMNAQTESADAIMIQLVTTEDKADDEKLHLLEKALQSEEMYKYIEDTYKGALGYQHCQNAWLIDVGFTK